MRQDIIIPERRYNRHVKIITRVTVTIVALPKHLEELPRYVFVERDDLLCASGDPLVVVMSCRVTRPDDEIDFVL
jgi:hypothetical protein